MPGTITHLAIANKILEKLPEGVITNKGLFYTGATAPDAIHARANFKRVDKKRTHMREDIADREFHEIENLSLFHSRVIDFINSNAHRDEGEIDLYKGYVVHVLSDELFLLNVRREFTQSMAEIGVIPTDIEFFHNLMYDLNQIDCRLAQENDEIFEIRDLFEKLEPCSVEGWITENELRHSRSWMINNYLHREHQLEEPKYISYNKALQYIEESAKDIILRLSERKLFPAIF